MLPYFGEITIGTFDNSYFFFPVHQVDHPLRLFHMFINLASAIGGIGGDTQHIESLIVQQQIGQGMLVIQFVIGISIEYHRYALFSRARQLAFTAIASSDQKKGEQGRQKGHGVFHSRVISVYS